MPDVPAEHDLRGRLAVVRRELDDRRVLERILDRVRVGRAVSQAGDALQAFAASHTQGKLSLTIA